MLDRGDWMQTHSGLRFYPLDPRPEDIRIEDIAHALPMICRFNGHCSRFYSVAEHSLLVAAQVNILYPESALYALLHDASEAYLCDVPRPLKRTPAMVSYRAMERAVEAAIAERFGLGPMMPLIVKTCDERALMTERRDLVPNAHLSGWTGNVVEPFAEPIEAERPIHEIRAAFVAAFAAYGGK